MPQLSDIRKNLASIEKLEKELSLKQLQVNRLLTITQAINDNVSARGLFEMYSSFLSWEMGVQKMALFFRESTRWICTANIGIDKSLLKPDMSSVLAPFTQLKNLSGQQNDPLLREFDLVIPVRHKDSPLAYVFIGGFDASEDTYSKVQFITTITNIIAVAIENKRLFKRQLEQERLKRDMELASEMQQLLIPDKLPSNDRYEFASIYKPHSSVGGDYYECIELENGLVAFCIADISGKGIAAALLMANFQATFQSLLKRQQNLPELVRELNCSVLRITHGERFITLFVAMFDPETRILQYVNAGHTPPAMVIDGALQVLDKGCTILGMFKELPFVELGSVQLDGEALILTYTDGLTDIRNEEGEFINEDYGYHFVQQHSTLSAGDFNKRLLEEVDRFRGMENYPDDFTVLTCKLF